MNQLIKLISTTECPDKQYNRISLTFDKAVDLVDGDYAYSCTFVSYKDEDDNIKALNCMDDECSLDINGAVNLIASDHEKVALDFILTKFETNLPTTPCTVTMKVSPLRASGINTKKNNGYEEI